MQIDTNEIKNEENKIEENNVEENKIKSFFKEPISIIRNVAENKNVNFVSIIIVYLSMFFTCFMLKVIDYWRPYGIEYAEKVKNKIGELLSESIIETILLVLIVSVIVYFMRKRECSFKNVFSTFVVCYSPLIAEYLIEIVFMLLRISTYYVVYFPFDVLVIAFTYVGMSALFKEKEMPIWQFVLVYIITNLLITGIS